MSSYVRRRHRASRPTPSAQASAALHLPPLLFAHRRPSHSPHTLTTSLVTQLTSNYSLFLHVCIPSIMSAIIPAASRTAFKRTVARTTVLRTSLRYTSTMHDNDPEVRFQHSNLSQFCICSRVCRSLKKRSSGISANSSTRPLPLFPMHPAGTSILPAHPRPA